MAYVKLAPDFEKKVIEALTERKALEPCPRCRNPKFRVIEGIVNQPLGISIGTVELSGTTVPLVAVTCTRCGFMAFHSIGVLGLLESLKPVMS